jgi:hypothetical protein
MQLDGVSCGQVQSWSGGNVSADVVETPISAFYLPKKNIGRITYNDFDMKMIGADSNPATDWIVQTLKNNFLRKSGEIRALDMQMKCRAIREFRDALVTGVTFPKCDSASKDATYLGLKFSPEIVRAKPGDDKAGTAGSNSKQKMLRAENFTFVMDGLEGACKRVNTIEAIEFKQTVAVDEVGELRDQAKEPGKYSLNNLTITCSEADAQPWMELHEDFVIKGNCTDDKEKNGVLTYIAQDQQKELITVTFSHIGIFNLTYDPLNNSEDKINRFKVECYVEAIEAAFGGFA